MNDLQLFQNEQFGQLRYHVDDEGQTWFCGKDIAEALEYAEESNPARLFAAVPDEWKGVKPIHTCNGIKQMLCLTEQGVYFFLGRSDKPKALPYQKWIAGEVVPSIRRSGGYIAARPDESPEEILARAVLVAQDTINKMKAQAEADRPKVVFAESVSISQTTILVGELAKLITQAGGPELGQNRLFNWFRNNGYVHKSGSQYNMPTQLSIESGWMVIKEGSRINSDGVSVLTRTTKITGKGQVYFINKFLGGLKLVAA